MTQEPDASVEELHPQLAIELDDVISDTSAHHYALVLTVIEEILSGSTPNDAVALIALRTGEDENFLRQLTIFALHQALQHRI
jgi:hypothetical protein